MVAFVQSPVWTRGPASPGSNRKASPDGTLPHGWTLNAPCDTPSYRFSYSLERMTGLYSLYLTCKALCFIYRTIFSVHSPVPDSSKMMQLLVSFCRVGSYRLFSSTTSSSQFHHNVCACVDFATSNLCIAQLLTVRIYGITSHNLFR